MERANLALRRALMVFEGDMREYLQKVRNRRILRSNSNQDLSGCIADGERIIDMLNKAAGALDWVDGRVYPFLYSLEDMVKNFNANYCYLGVGLPDPNAFYEELNFYIKNSY